jgi:alpha-galactosidase
MSDIVYDASNRCWLLQTEASSYCMQLSEDATSLRHIYWGPRIDQQAAHEIARATPARTYPFEMSSAFAQEEYLPWGGIRFNEPGLKVEYADGTRAIEWAFENQGVERSAASQVLWLTFKDREYAFRATLYYRIYAGHDVIERWVRLANGAGHGPVVLEQAFSANWWTPPRKSYRLTYLHGRWGAETQVKEITPGPGKFVLESRRGTTSHHFNPWIALDPMQEATEDSGDVWSTALALSGSWKMVIETTLYGSVHCTGGINDFDFTYRLEEGAHLDLPAFVGLYSSEGFGGVSRRWHAYELEHVLPASRDEVRPVLFNSWEATSFDVNEHKQTVLAEKAAQLGVEVFVIDDGWFGARNNDHAGLGDWTVNRNKFPDGLHSLIARVNELGMRFGIWVEPEMVNPDSDLYRAHPDWVYHFPHRSRTELRNQLVLNLARDDVRQWMFATFDQLLSENAIEFVKWDMNRPFSEPGWTEEVGKNPRRIWLDHVRNLYQILDELRHRHPTVAFESCSGGGGRVDLGILSRVDQVWTSDNTDAFDRLRIQEGFSFAYAPRVMMCWVTDCPNFLTRRTIPLKYRFHSAMAGSLGIGGDLAKWSDEELAEARELVKTYKRVRPVIQNGLVYRLRSPRKASVTATEYVARNGSEVVVLAWGHSQQFGASEVLLQLRGIEDQAVYRDTEHDASYRGAYLMQHGLPVKLIGDFDSQMVHLVRTSQAQQ